MKTHLSRRDALLRCAAAGALRIAPWLSVAEAVTLLEAQERKPTQWNGMGPFYKRLAPQPGAVAADGRSGPAAREPQATSETQH